MMKAIQLIHQRPDVLDELALRGLVGRSPLDPVLTERGQEALEAAEAG